MGNSRSATWNLGAGRVAVPDLPRIDKAIADGSLAGARSSPSWSLGLKQSGGAST